MICCIIFKFWYFNHTYAHLATGQAASLIRLNNINDMATFIDHTADRQPASRTLLRALDCLAFLLLVSPALEQAHADHCDEQACYACAALTSDVVPSDVTTTPIAYAPSNSLVLDADTSPCEGRPHAYSSRGPPEFSR